MDKILLSKGGQLRTHQEDVILIEGIDALGSYSSMMQWRTLSILGLVVVPAGSC